MGQLGKALRRLAAYEMARAMEDALRRTVKLVFHSGDAEYRHVDPIGASIKYFGPERVHTFLRTGDFERDIEVFKECPPGWEAELS